MTAVEFRSISKAYGQNVAVDNVTFAVPEACVFGLLGPNGAGKTTLLRALMDIIAPDSGTITLFGRPLDRVGLDRVGYLPEESGLYQQQKVADVLTYFGRLKGLARPDARRGALRWLERMQLSETAGWHVERLSKGMRQKVQIAASLIADPVLAVLDEPFSGLDPVNVLLVQELIRERRAAGTTTILSTHQMGQVESLCERVALIDRARLMVDEETETLRQRHSGREVIVRAASAPPQVEGVAKVSVDARDALRHSFLLELAPGAKPASVLRALVASDVAIESFEPVLASMEEVFLALVGSGEPVS